MKRKNDFLLIFNEAEEDDIENTDELNQEEEKPETNQEPEEEKPETNQENQDEEDNVDENPDGTEEVDENSETEDNTVQSEEELEEKRKENCKRLTFFKNYKKLYLLIEDLIVKIDSIYDINNEDEKNKNLIIFIKEKSNKLLNNINIILKDKIETLDLKVLETVFINIKSESNLLIDLIEKVLKQTESKTKNETIS